MDGSFMSFMLVCLRSSAGRNGHDLQVDSLRPHRFRRDPWRVQKGLLAGEFRPCPHDSADRLAMAIGNFRHHVYPFNAVSIFRSLDNGKVIRFGGLYRRPDVDLGYFEFLSGQYRSAFAAGINQ